MAINSGNMNRIIGPTRPTLGSPFSSTPKPPIPATGVHPDSMKKAVIKPQAMNAAIFGMIMPDRKVPNFWTATRVLRFLLAATSACAVMSCLSVESRARLHLCQQRFLPNTLRFNPS
jgi:hypothetical protein